MFHFRFLSRAWTWWLLAACLSCPACRRRSEPQPAQLSDTPAPVIAIGDQDWPWWRGPSGDGTSRSPAAVTHWSATENILWTAPVPGRGHSSPIVCGDRVIVTTADEARRCQQVLAFRRSNGERLWETTVHAGNLPPKHEKNSHASATPACDGHRIYTAFVHGQALYVSALDMEGQIVWQNAAGEFVSEHGYGSSPVLYQSLVIVNGDSLGPSFVAALDRGTGRRVWSTPRETNGSHGSYATPIIAALNGRDQLLLSGMSTTMSYDPRTGEVLWSCRGPAVVTACTAAFGEGLVFSSGGFPERQLLAIRADGSGDVSDSHVVWRTNSGVAYVPTPLYHAGLLYVVNDEGIATCWEAATGERVWQRRLAGSFSASPTLAGELIFATNEEGKSFVFRTGRQFEMVAENELGAGGFASPVICGGQIFLRTANDVYCIGPAARP